MIPPYLNRVWLAVLAGFVMSAGACQAQPLSGQDDAGGDAESAEPTNVVFWNQI